MDKSVSRPIEDSARFSSAVSGLALRPHPELLDQGQREIPVITLFAQPWACC
jgi:hypothetical protein